MGLGGGNMENWLPVLVVVGIVLLWFAKSFNVIKEWERGAVLRLGRMLPDAKGAGLRIILWPIETLYRIPLRIVTLDVPPQDIITKDNVSVKVNAVCYFKVVDANRALQRCRSISTGRNTFRARPRKRETSADSRPGHRSVGHQSDQGRSEAGR